MNYKSKFLEYNNIAVGYARGDNSLSLTNMLGVIIEMIDKDKFNNWIETFFYLDEYITFEEAFHDLHKQLRVGDPFGNSHLDMLMWHFIAGSGKFERLCADVIKGDKNSKFYDEDYAI